MSEPEAMKVRWDPDQYRRFASHRLRPALDLAARLEGLEPRTVYDLGCGTGEITRILATRWPAARVRGIDSSEAMLEQGARGGDRRSRRPDLRARRSRVLDAGRARRPPVLERRLPLDPEPSRGLPSPARRARAGRRARGADADELGPAVAPRHARGARARTQRRHAVRQPRPARGDGAQTAARDRGVLRPPARACHAKSTSGRPSTCRRSKARTRCSSG